MAIQLIRRKSFFLGTLIATFFVSGVFSASASVLTKPANNLGIVAYYPFIEGSGTTTADYSGQNLKATLTTAPTWTASGKFGYGLDFSAGSFQYLSVPHNAALNFSYAMTYAAWVKPTLGTQVSLISKGAYGDAFRVLIQGGTAPERVPAIQIDGATIYGTTAIVSGSWTHVAFTYDGVVTKIYVNGALTDTSTSANGILATTATTMYIGQGGSDNIYYNGVMDEVYLFQRALSAAEIATLYARTPTGGRQRVIINQSTLGPLASSNLVFFLKLDESSGNAADSSPAGLTFTNNSTVSYVGGKINNAARFSGSNYLSRADSAALSPTTAATWSFWFYKTTAYSGSNNMFTSKWIFNSNNGWGHRTNGTEFEATLENYNYYGITSGLGLAANTWYHAVVVFNGAGVGNSGRLKVYINGVEKTLTYGGTIPTTITDNASAFEIGGWTNVSYYFTGIIDEFGFWNKALTSAEVAVLYNNGDGRAYPFRLTKVTNGTSMNTVAASNLIDWHTFDGPYLNTTTSTDRSGQGKDGTLSGTPTPTIGKVGQALKFNGSTSYVTTPTVSTPSAISVAAWVYSANYGAAMFVVEKAVVNSEWQLFFENGNLYWATNNHDLVCTAPANDTWHHIVATQTGSSGRLYIDGVQCATGESVPAIGQGTGLIWIGAYDNFYGSIGYPFNGKIDDVRIYNKALSAAEVLTLYNQTK